MLESTAEKQPFPILSVQVSVRHAIATGLAACVLLGASAVAAERVVLLEHFTNANCAGCAAANSAVDALIATNPDGFLPLDLFTENGGPFTTAWGQNRAAAYGVSATPTAWFDGAASLVNSPTPQAAYQSAINTRASVAADITIDLSLTHLQAEQYQFVAVMTLDSGAASDREVEVSVVEAIDGLGAYSGSSTPSRNTFKRAIGSSLAYTLSPGQPQQLAGSISLDPQSLDRAEDVRLITWVQAPMTSGPAEVYNAAYVDLPTLLSGDYNDDGVVDAADYTVWRDNLGAIEGTLPNDLIGGPIGVPHYDAWRANLGATSAPSAASDPAPEPQASMLLATVLLASLRRQAREDALPSP